MKENQFPWIHNEQNILTLPQPFDTKIQEKIMDKNSSASVSFLVGRNFFSKNSDSQFDYMVLTSMPIINQFDVNLGYEFNQKMIFVGGTLRF